MEYEKSKENKLLPERIEENTSSSGIYKQYLERLL